MMMAMLLMFAGCGSGKTLRGISGEVTFDGEPVESGDIQFLPEVGTPEGSNIIDGKYAANVSPGKMKVRIYASKPHPTQTTPNADPSAPDLPLMVEYIPAKYNESTELAITVEGDGETHNFVLTSE
jgi:hypothetical protein